MTSIVAHLRRFQISLPRRLMPDKETIATLNDSPIDLPTSSDESRLAFERGKTLYRLGCYDEAIGEFGKMLRLNWRDENASVWIEKVKLAREWHLERITNDRETRASSSIGA